MRVFFVFFLHFPHRKGRCATKEQRVNFSGHSWFFSDKANSRKYFSATFVLWDLCGKNCKTGRSTATHWTPLRLPRTRTRLTDPRTARVFMPADVLTASIVFRAAECRGSQRWQTSRAGWVLRGVREEDAEKPEQLSGTFGRGLGPVRRPSCPWPSNFTNPPCSGGTRAAGRHLDCQYVLNCSVLQFLVQQPFSLPYAKLPLSNGFASFF